MKLRTLHDLHPKKQRVLVGVDYNVPVAKGVVGDPLRIQASFDTLNYLLDRGNSLVLISHLGRPGGKKNPELSLAPVAKKATSMLGRPVMFIPDCVGPQAEAATKSLGPGEILLLENTRFHPGEEKNDPRFARQLAELGDVFVDDAFANIHRAHASTVGVAHYLESAAGCLVEKEVEHITSALRHPHRPLYAVIGGAKVSTKIEVLMNLMKHVDRLLVAGAMANTFFAADGKQVGHSIYEPGEYGTVKQLRAEAKRRNVELMLPEDLVVAPSREHGPTRHVHISEVDAKDFIVDIGPASIAKFMNPLSFHGTIIWNGPLGITEVPEFAHGSRQLAENIIESGAKSIIGGGDTAAFVDEAGLHDKFSWVSTGGGASLELMAGRELPGLKVLRK